MEPLGQSEQDAVDAFKKINGNGNRKGRPSKEFGPALKIAARVLKDSGKLNNNDIAAELKVSPATVAKMLKDRDVVIDVSDMDKVRTEFQGYIANICKRMLITANNDVYIERLGSVRNTSLVSAFAQMLNALQNLSGKPTSIVEVRDTAADVAKQSEDLTKMEEDIRQAIAARSKNPQQN